MDNRQAQPFKFILLRGDQLLYIAPPSSTALSREKTHGGQ
jgi:hypothetical protein